MGEKPGNDDKKYTQAIINFYDQNFIPEAYMTGNLFWAQDIIATVLQELLKTNEISLPDVHAIDFGCGTASVLEFLLARGVGSCTGIDISNGMIEKARSRLGDRASVIKGDFRDPTIVERHKGKCNLGIAIGAGDFRPDIFSHVKDLLQYMQDGSVLLVIEFPKGNFRGNSKDKPSSNVGVIENNVPFVQLGQRMKIPMANTFLRMLMRFKQARKFIALAGNPNFVNFMKKASTITVDSIRQFERVTGSRVGIMEGGSNFNPAIVIIHVTQELRRRVEEHMSKGTDGEVEG